MLSEEIVAEIRMTLASPSTQVRIYPENTNYVVTDCGNVFSLHGGFVSRLKPRRHRTGYLQVTLSPERKTVLVHRMVCRSFHGEAPLGQNQARHLNDLRHDNRACNLAWGCNDMNREDQVRNRGKLVVEPSVIRSLLDQVRDMDATIRNLEITLTSLLG